MAIHSIYCFRVDDSSRRFYCYI